MHDANQIEMATLNQLVSQDHPYRKILDLIDLGRLCEPISLAWITPAAVPTGSALSPCFNACCCSLWRT